MTPFAAAANPSLRWRWLVSADLPALLVIEAASFPDPWTEADFLRVLGHRDVFGFAAEEQSHPDLPPLLVGFLVIERFSDRRRVLRLAVSPPWRRRGAGRFLLSLLANPPGKIAEAVIRETNLPAHLFFRACGWRAAAVWRRFCPDDEDAYLFALNPRGESESVAEAPDAK